MKLINYLLLKNYILACSILFLSFFAKASETDTSYIQNFKNIFSVKGLIYFNDYTYSLIPRNTAKYNSQQLKNVSVNYNSYLPATLGLSFNLRGLNLSFDFRNKMDFLYSSDKEKSSYRKFMLHFYGNKYGFEFYIKRFKHFYFDYRDNTIYHENYSDDMSAFQIGINNVFTINHKRFSYKAAFYQAAMQKKSAGSMIFIPAWRYENVKNNAFIPDSISQYYSVNKDIDKIKYNSFLLYMGYGFNIVKKYMYFSGAFLVGTGVQNQKYHLNFKKTHSETVMPVSGMAKLGLGYNGPTFIAGIFANADICQTQVYDLKTKQIVYNYGIFIGLRTVKYKKVKTRE